MFITVRFGDGEESIFNPNCRTNILLEDIKRRCNCTKDDSRGAIIHSWSTHVVDCFVLATVDLSDESGNLKYLADHPTTYATEILKARESFVLIRVEKKGETEGDSYTPMLNDVIIVTPQFLERLSRCESDSLNAKSSIARPARLNSPLTRKQTGLQGKIKTSQLPSSSRNKTSREKTPGQKRNRESR